MQGEEAIEADVLHSIVWRLFPYWFNRWEQEWGVECSSMLYALPHFAIELLVVLPLVQVCLSLRVRARKWRAFT